MESLNELNQNGGGGRRYLAGAKITALFSSFFLNFLGPTVCRIFLFQSGKEPVPPGVEAWSVNHWITREVPTSTFNIFQEESPEKAMAPHSSTLAWKIPWMEEPGRL